MAKNRHLIMVKIEPSEKQELKRICDELDMSMSALVKMELRKLLIENGIKTF